MPRRTRYWYIDGNMTIKEKGAAQHNPFTTFALIGHFKLFFIRARTEQTTLENFRKVAPNVAAKLTSQSITNSYTGALYFTATSPRTVPMTTAIETSIKSRPKALLVSIGWEFLCTNNDTSIIIIYECLHRGEKVGSDKPLLSPIVTNFSFRFCCNIKSAYDPY